MKLLILSILLVVFITGHMSAPQYRDDYWEGDRYGDGDRGRYGFNEFGQRLPYGGYRGRYSDEEYEHRHRRPDFYDEFDEEHYRRRPQRYHFDNDGRAYFDGRPFRSMGQRFGQIFDGLFGGSG